jgi:hypothetical protein
MKALINDISEEKNGFKLGEPWRYSENSLGLVIPILRETKEDRQYILLEETKKVKLSDTGDISRVKVVSNESRPVFIRVGSIVKGATQERAMETSIIIDPQSEAPDVTVKKGIKVPAEGVEVPVRCVHATRGISGGAIMAFAGHAPRSLDIQFMAKADQRQVWGSVNHYSAQASSRLMSMGHRITMDDNLLGNIEKVAEYDKDIKKAIKNVPVLENQVGAVIFDQAKVVGIELFDHPKSWETYHENIILKYGDVLVKKEESLFELKRELIPKKIKDFFNEIKGLDSKVSYKANTSVTYQLTGDDYIGEYTEFNKEVIHLLVMRASKPEKMEDDILPRPQRRPYPDIYGGHHEEREEPWRSGIRYFSNPKDDLFQGRDSVERKFLHTLKDIGEPTTYSEVSAIGGINPFKARKAVERLETDGLLKRADKGKKLWLMP